MGATLRQAAVRQPIASLTDRHRLQQQHVEARREYRVALLMAKSASRNRRITQICRTVP